MATRNQGPFFDVLTDAIEPIPGLRSDLHGALSKQVKSDTPACAAAHQKVRKTPNLVDFICAQDPRGEIWSVVVTLKEVPARHAPTMTEGSGDWQLSVASGSAVQFGAKQSSHHENPTDCTGQWLSTPWDPDSCYATSFVEPMSPPGSFWFYEPKGRREMHAFAFSGEADNTGYGEQSIVWWVFRNNALSLHSASERAAIAFIRQCEGRLAILVNPYRRAGDDFQLHFGNFRRKTAPEWTVLGIVEEGDVRFDHELSKRFAAKQCSNASELPFAVDPFWWPHTIHCRKLFGAVPQGLAVQLDEACRKPSNAKAAEFCKSNRAILDRMISADLPLRLSSQERTAAELPVCLQDLVASRE